jgi:multicomponent Na+:H+ antiporter subunit F
VIVVGWIVASMLLGAVVLAVLKILTSRQLGDRGVALDVLTSTITSATVVWAAVTGTPVFVVVALVLSLVGFLASVTIARYMEDHE